MFAYVVGSRIDHFFSFDIDGKECKVCASSKTKKCIFFLVLDIPATVKPIHCFPLLNSSMTVTLSSVRAALEKVLGVRKCMHAVVQGTYPKIDYLVALMVFLVPSDNF